MDLELIQSHQAKDLLLQKALKEDKEFTQAVAGNVTLIHFMNDRVDKPKIVVPYFIQYPSIRWMHSLLGHVGISRLSATLKKHFWFHNMTKLITEFVSKCEFCQRYNKQQTVKYGLVPPMQIKHLHLWEEVSVDMIGPWKVEINRFEYHFRALTCVDSIIGLPEVIPVDNATSLTVAQAFEDNWLSRYPAPLRCFHDNGNEFLGPAFSFMLQRNKIKSVLATVKKRVEHMHQSISTVIPFSFRENPPHKYGEVSTFVFRKCMATQNSIRATINMALQHTPGELVFGRDMLLSVPSRVDWK